MNNEYHILTKMEIHFEIISQCALNCVHCSSESDIKRISGQLSPTRIENFLKLISKDVDLYICLTGGEPLFSDQFFSILGKLKQFGNIKGIGFFTSGCIVTEQGEIEAISEKISMRLREAGITFCYTSLYSHLANVHDLVTRVLGSHKFSINSVRNLLNSGIETKINFVLMKYNQGGLKKAIYFLNDLGATEVRFLRLVKHGRAKNNWGLIGLTKDEQKIILERTIKNVAKNRLKIRITVAGFPEIWDCRPFGTGEMCQAGIGLHYVDWEGRIFPCACKKREEISSICNIDDADVSKKLLSSRKLYNIKCLQDI